jgi:O-antigen/teichoic acid export membrane protein
MHRKIDLIKNTGILGLGTFLPHISALITLPIYTDVLTKTEFGLYDLSTVTAYLIVVLVTLEIHQAIFRFLVDLRGKETENCYITNTVIFVLFPSIIAAIIFGLVFQTQPLFLRFLLSLYLFLNIQFTVTGQITRGLGNNKVYSIGLVIKSALNVLLVLILMAGFNLRLSGLFISLNIALFLGIFYQVTTCEIHHRIKPRLLEKGIIIELIRYSWPMVPNIISLWIVNSSPKYIISLFLGLPMNAIFAVAGKIPNIFNFAFLTFNLAWQESASLSVLDDDKDDYINSIFKDYLNFITGAMMLLIGTAPLLFPLLIKGPYDEAYNQMPLLFIGMYLSGLSMFFGGIYIAHKRTFSIGISSAIAAIASCIINLALITHLGLFAASISMVLSFLILALYRGIDIKKKSIVHIKYNFVQIVTYFLLIVISSLLCYKQSKLTDIINFLLGIIVFLILNKRLFQVGLKQITLRF